MDGWMDGQIDRSREGEQKREMREMREMHGWECWRGVRGREGGRVLLTLRLILSELMDPSISTLSDSLREIMTGFRSTSLDFPTST